MHPCVVHQQPYEQSLRYSTSYASCYFQHDFFVGFEYKVGFRIGFGTRLEFQCGSGVRVMSLGLTSCLLELDFDSGFGFGFSFRF